MWKKFLEGVEPARFDLLRELSFSIVFEKSLFSNGNISGSTVDFFV